MDRKSFFKILPGLLAVPSIAKALAKPPSIQGLRVTPSTVGMAWYRVSDFVFEDQEFLELWNEQMNYEKERQ